MAKNLAFAFFLILATVLIVKAVDGIMVSYFGLTVLQ